MNKILGIDVSAFQPNVDWSKMVADGIQFVYIKVTEGGFTTDSKAAIHAQEAQAAGLKIGYYHFAYNGRDGKTNAENFAREMKLLPTADLLPVLDIESNTGKLSPAQMQVWIQQFIDTLNELGYPKIMLYSYTPFLIENLPADHPFGNLPLWIAQYTNAAQPTLPRAWSNCALWQFTNKGSDVLCDENKTDDLSPILAG